MALLYACIIYDGARSVKFEIFLNSRPTYYTIAINTFTLFNSILNIEKRESNSNSKEANMEIVSNVLPNHKDAFSTNIHYS